MTSESNLFQAKGNKPFAPVKRASLTGPSASYKLSSKVKNMLSNELKTPTNGGCGDDSSIQSTNSRRRFQRRGSKSASMFKAFASADHFNIPESLFERVREKTAPANNENNMLLRKVLEIQTDSEHSCTSHLGESSVMGDSSISLDLASDEFGC